MIKRYTHFALTAVLSLWITTATAQSQTAPESESVEVPRLRALTIGLENNLTTLEILDGSLQSIGQLALREQAFSEEFTSPIVEGKLIFGVPNGTDEEGKPLFRQVASVKWNRSMRQTCLIFVPKSLVGKSQNANDYGIQLLDMSPSAFKFGHTKILNFTPLNTMVRMGEHKEKVAAWGSANLSKINDVTELNMAQIEVYYIFNDKVHTAHQTRIRYLDRVRYITLIYPDIQNKRIAVNIIKDFGKLY
jgi:hypothetical protein